MKDFKFLKFTKKYISSFSQSKAQLFENEKIRQKSLVTKIEKINVSINGPPQECNLMVNKCLSTPYDSARHINDITTYKSALALVNDIPWDMHQPLIEDCSIYFLHFKDENPQTLNKIFWRTSSLLLGHILENAFKLSPDLHSWVPTDVSHGLVAYDFYMPFHWVPNQEEIRILSRQLSQLCWKQLTIEPLLVDTQIALDIFKDSKFKKIQIEKIASAESTSGRTVKLYRVGNYVDISSGPMVANTRLFGRFDIVNIFKLPEDKCGENMYRAQAIALPSQLMLHQWTWNLLKKKAAIPFMEYLPPKLEDIKDSKRISLPDPPVVKPSNVGWETMHANTKSRDLDDLKGIAGWDESKKKQEFIEKSGIDSSKSPLHRISNNIVVGEMAHDTRLRFYKKRNQWAHIPVFWKKSKPSIHVGNIDNRPTDFITIPKNKASL